MFREKLSFELRVSWKEKWFFSLSKASDFLCVFRLSVINYLKVSNFDAKLMAQWVQLSINHLHFNLRQCIFRLVASIWALDFHKICRKAVPSCGNGFWNQPISCEGLSIKKTRTQNLNAVLGFHKAEVTCKCKRPVSKTTQPKLLVEVYLCVGTKDTPSRLNESHNFIFQMGT